MPARGSTQRRSNNRPVRRDPAIQGVIDAAYRLQKAGSLEQAELLYQRVLASEPGNPFALYALGTIALRHGNAEAAVVQLRQALDQGYDHETVYAHLGIAFQALGDEQSALAVYRQALAKDPRNPRYLANAAVILAQQGHTEEALAETRKALALDAAFGPALVNAGFFLQTLGRLDEAARMFEQALAGEPANAQVRDALQALRQKIALEGS